MAYPRRSVMHVATPHALIVERHHTLADVERALEKAIGTLESFNYGYVVDARRRLIGVFSVKDLYRHKKTTPVEAIAKKTSLITVGPLDTQEHAALLALKHNIMAIPVVDETRKLLGVVADDAILKIIHKEAREDILHITGVHPSHFATDNILETPLYLAIRHRIVWLIVGLLGGVLAARVIGLFEKTLEQNLLLAAFIPLIVYMSDAVRTQMEAFVIRDLNNSRHFNLGKYFFKQLSIVVVIAAIMGAILGVLSAVLYNDVTIAIVLSSALTIAIVFCIVTGFVVPLVFSRMKIDPANASGPIATILQDITSVAIYFAIASWLL